MALEVPISRMAAWTPGPPEDAPEGLDWSSGAPELSAVPPLLRRRMGDLARGMVHCALRAAGDRPDCPMVFASRHGDVARTLDILRELAAGKGVSPMAFSLSVHNAPAGLLAIHMGNRAGQNAVAAGEATWAWGLADAYATWVRDPSRPILYVYGEEPLPEPMEGFREPGAAPCAMALLLGHPGTCALRLDWQATEAGTAPLPMPLAFLASLKAGHGTWRGGGQAWTWDVC